jgi:type VI secretion system secreted protein Hcp
VPVTYLVITMEDVIISGVHHVGAESANGDLLLESCSLNYAKIEFKYTPVNADGSLGAPISAGFDLKKNKFIGSVAPILTEGLLQGL